MFLNKFITRNSHIGGIPVASITAFIFTFIIFYAIMRFLSNYEEKEINKKIMNNENNKNNQDKKSEYKSIFNIFISKRSVIPLTIGVLLSLRLRSFITILTDTLVNPIFKLDIDKDRIPDISELANYLNLTIFGLKYNFGLAFLEFVKITIFMLITYFFILIVYFNTNWINIDLN